MPNLRQLFRHPAKTIPQTPWSNSGGQWNFEFKSFFMLIIGLWIFGSGEAALINSGIGVSPWTVLAEGLAKTIDVGVGLATFLVSATVLLLWLPLKQLPGIGTIANAIVIAIAIDVMRNIYPTPTQIGFQLLMVVLGVSAVGLGSAIYLTAKLGPGPRDGWMTGLHYRFGWPISRVRLGIELSVLTTGWLLGGTVGLGTAIFAIFIGWMIAVNLALMPKTKN
ncbi:MAG: hypothetical protein RIT32_211 [Actinomycetota bacterium]